MVHNKDPALSATFAALADPTRRAMLAQLSRLGEQSAGELAAPHAMSLPAALKHVKVLSDAGLVKRQKVGRTVRCRLDAAPMRSAAAWLDRYQKFWSERLDALAAFVEEDNQWTARKSPASRSGATLKHRSKKSSRRGPSPKR